MLIYYFITSANPNRSVWERAPILSVYDAERVMRAFLWHFVTQSVHSMGVKWSLSLVSLRSRHASAVVEGDFDFPFLARSLSFRKFYQVVENRVICLPRWMLVVGQSHLQLLVVFLMLPWRLLKNYKKKILIKIWFYCLHHLNYHRRIIILIKINFFFKLLKV